MPYIKPYSPSGAAFSTLGDLLMKFLSQYKEQQREDKNRAEDRAVRKSEFDTTTGMEKQRIDLEQQRMTADEVDRRAQRATQNAGIAVDQATPGVQDPAQAALLTKLLEGTPYAARLQKSGQAGTLPSTQLSPDAVGGLRSESNPGGEVSRLLPTFAQRTAQQDAEMKAKQFANEQAQAPFIQRLLSGQKTDTEKEADRIHELAIQHGYDMEKIRVSLNMDKKTSVDDDISKVVAAYSAAAKYADLDPEESKRMQHIGDMLADYTEKKHGIKLREDNTNPALLGDIGPQANPFAGTKPAETPINYPAAIKDFLTGGAPVMSSGGGLYAAKPGQPTGPTTNRNPGAFTQAVFSCPKDDPRYLTDPEYCKPKAR